MALLFRPFLVFTVNIDKVIIPKDIKLFLKKFAPPTDLQKLIHLHKNILVHLPNKADRGFMAMRKGYIGTIPELPGFYIKGEHIDRVINAYRIEQILTQHTIKTITVPKKYVYKIGSKYMVFVEELDIEDLADYDRSQDINAEEMKDMILFLEYSGYSDLTYTNIVRNSKTKKLVILDTENSALNPHPITYYKGMKLKDIYKHFFIGNKILDANAEKVFADYYQKDELNTIIPLYENSKYDSPDIDLRVVQDFFKNQIITIFNEN